MDLATAVTVLTAVAIMVGIAGTVIPVLPGSLLVAAVVLVWAMVLHTPVAWVTAAVVAAVAGFGGAAGHLFTGRRLIATGVPKSTLLIAGVVGLVGFFVVPVVGLPLGIVTGVYGSEAARSARLGGGHASAWLSTKATLKALGLGMLIEATCTAAAGAVWFGAVLLLHAGRA